MAHQPRQITTGGEFPSRDQLLAMGELTFLYLRASIYQKASVAQLRSVLQPPVDTGHFAIMRQNGVPRGAITFAMVDEATEEKLISGALLTPKEWISGDRIWILDLIAPYGHGTTAELMRFWHRSLSPEVTQYHAQRWGKSREAVRRFTARRLPNGRWGSRMWKDPYQRPDDLPPITPRQRA